MQIINEIVSWISIIGCLFAASFLMFYTLVGIRFYDYRDKNKIENRWRNDNRAGRLGGVGIFILFVITMKLWPETIIVNDINILVSLFFIGATGFIDDVKQTSWVKRLVMYAFLSVSICSCYMYFHNPITLLFPLVVFFGINSFNMLDNMDLIAPLTALQILVCISIISGDIRFAIFGFLLLPFIYFNWIGKLMMGDCGSTVLGAIFGICAIWMLSNSVPWYSVILIFSIPITDTVFVLVRRLLEKRPLWIGGTDHLTHCLARYMGEREAVGILFIIGLIFSVAGILLK